jgi:DNA-binding response OmpR family regulator
LVVNRPGKHWDLQGDKVGKILFIDDDTDSLAMYVKAVSLAGHQADIASSVSEGWDLVKDNAYAYDLIFVDLNIPGVSGFDFLKSVMKDPKINQTPIIVISAMPEDSAVDDVLEAGAKLFLEKPVALSDLYAVIGTFEEKKSQNS